MSFPAPGCLVRHHFSSKSNNRLSIDLYYKPENPISADSGFDVADDIAGQQSLGMSLAWANWAAVDAFYFGATSLIHSDDLAFPGHGILDSAVAGSQEGESLPDHTAAVIRRYTITAGRKGRGRVFMPCVCEFNEDNGSLSAGGLLALRGILTFIEATMSTADGGMNTWAASHWVRGDAELELVEDWYAASTLVTMRRRRLREFA